MTREPQGPQTPYQAISAVLADIRRRGTARLTDERRRAVEAQFGDFGSFLLAAQRRWFLSFEGHLDSVMEDVPVYSGIALNALCAEVTRKDPELVRLLAEYADDPGLQQSVLHYQRKILMTLGFDPGALSFPGNSRRGSGLRGRP